ncbi:MULTISPECIES: tetratricopeptide repeat protein [unclassified Streptomyces]|uniref:tetratricopeptide repeat protein n=1 Tax=unclassified Streptomyces TaxID=2593676 RepID=UPI00082389F7|nr:MULTISPECIES: tetratricopeptide repeat protein [unclassified Streptomyces]MYU00323.1 protein kinase [Streptomyces sp. SID8350]SCK05680.1 serine/threonine-protein kinase PknG [Streptomyces sp. AmelKG-D3]
MSTQCQRPECEGAYEDMGGGELYCDTCGLAPVVSPTGMVSSPPTGIAGGGRAAGRDSSSQRSSSRASSRSSSRSSSSRRSVSGRLSRSLSGSAASRSVSVRSSGASAASSARGRLGVGLVEVPGVPRPDPRTAVMENPEVPERKRFCSRSDCGAPVGRSRGERPGRTEGFCTKCGHPYSFVPKLTGGDIVHGQYEVAGCLAHGGLGWVYLAVDRAVSDRWVVLKGLLDTGDQDAMAAAISERRFLAEIEHANIVRIYNFVEHLDQRTGSLDGYIVMEYVGGKALKEIANQRRTPSGRRDPLPVEQACAYGIEALEALGHLHSRNLLYCDFKVDNAIQTEDQLKLIDMGAVRRMDDDESAIYGTVGYQAPEVAEVGPSVASDLYTVARTLAVLTFDFQGYTNVYVDSLPDPDTVEVFRAYESFYRLLVRATDPDPGRRFASASEMAEQLTGVLREVVALQSGRPRPALSTLFGAELRVTDTELFAEQVDDVSRLGARPTAPGRGGLFGRRGGGSKGGAAGSGAGPLPGIPAQGGGAPGQGGSASGGPVAPGAVTSAVAGALPVGGQPPGAGAGRGGPGAAPLTATATHVRGGAQGTGAPGGSHAGSRGGPSPGAQGTGAQASPYGGPRAGNVREGAHGGPRGTGEPGESRGGGPAAHARPAPSPVPTAHREAGSGPAHPGPATPYGPFRAAAGGVRLAPFDAPATALALPVPRVDANDPNAGFLAGLMASAPAELIAALEAVPAASLETGLRELRARLELREQDAAAAASAALEARHPDDWRVVWYRGVTSLVTGDHEVAALSFDAVYDAFPGESAPKLALGICAEVLGQLDNAAEYYRLVWATDPGFVSAAFGLARVQIAAGDRAGAARTLESVPEASIHYTAARVATVRARLRERDAAEPLTADLTAAGAQVAALTGFGLDPVRREQLTTEVLGKALDWVLSGSPGAPPPGGSAAGPPETRKLLGAELNERGLRLGLERSYRMLARLAQRGEERIELVERANRFRPRTWV